MALPSNVPAAAAETCDNISFKLSGSLIANEPIIKKFIPFLIQNDTSLSVLIPPPNSILIDIEFLISRIIDLLLV